MEGREPMDMPPCAYSDGRIGNSARVVLSFLYMHVNRKRGDMFVYWPVRRIAKSIHGRIPASIRRDLTSLTEAGYIEKSTITIGGAKREGWTILVFEGVQDAPGYRTHPGTPRTQEGTGRTHARVQDAPPVNTEVNQEENPEVNCPPNGRPHEANNAQLSLAGCPEEPTVPKVSPRENWIKAQWELFIHVHRQLQDRLIESGALRRTTTFNFTNSHRRMLAKLHSEKYTKESLFISWTEMAHDAEQSQSIKYFRPTTSFVARNIDRKLEDRANIDAEYDGDEE